MPKHVYLGIVIASLYFLFFFGVLMMAIWQMPDIKEQKKQPWEGGLMDNVDKHQQKELDRQHKVDEFFDKRLDKLERRDVFMGTAVLINSVILLVLLFGWLAN